MSAFLWCLIVWAAGAALLLVRYWFDRRAFIERGQRGVRNVMGCDLTISMIVFALIVLAATWPLMLTLEIVGIVRRHL